MAKDILEIAIDVNENSIKEKYDEALIYSQLSNSYEGLGNYNIALEFNLKAIDLIKQYNPSNTYALLANINSLAGLYMNLGLYQKAKRIWEEVLISYEKKFGKSDAAYYATLENLAIVNNDLGNTEYALELQLNANSFYKKYYGKKHLWYLKSLHQTTFYCDNYEDIKKYNNLSLKYRKKQLKHDPISYAFKLGVKSSLLYEDGLFNEALFLSQQVLDIYKENLNENNWIINHYYYALSSIF